MEVSFTINTKAANEALKKLFHWHNPRKGSPLHIVVQNGTVVLATANKAAFSQPVPAITKGTGEVILPRTLFESHVLSKQKEISVTIRPGIIDYGTSVYTSAAIELKALESA